MRIDAHQHYWQIGRGDYGWITKELPELFRDYSPKDLVSHLKKHELDGSIVVQAAPTYEETDYILTLADQTPSILGVVGWLNLFDQNHRSHYDRFRRNPKFVGFRIMIQDMNNPYRILEPDFVEAVRAYAEEDIPIDLLLLSDQLEPAIQLFKQVPGIRGVINHIAKPRIRDGVLEPWWSSIQEVARFPNIYCKLSGMVTEADHESWKPENFTSYIRHVLNLFGSERVMFGSDWPVCLLAASYDQVVEVLKRALPEDWSETELIRVFGGNAKVFYKL
jgi:L-fuconolactonase